MSILYLQTGKKQVNYVSLLLSPSLQSHTVCNYMIFSPSIEAPPFASTALPVAAVPRILLRLYMEVIDVVHQVLQGVKEQMALEEGKQ